jgi:hypothetical protein
MKNLSRFYKLIKQAKNGKVDMEAITDVVYSLEDHELPIAQKQLNNLTKKQ